jgi:cell division inhibitor SepF
MAAFFNKIIDKVRGFDQEDEYDEYEVLVEEDSEQDQEIDLPSENRTGFFRKNTKVVDFGKKHNSGQQVVIIQPSSIESAQEVSNHLRSGRTVICNFEKIDQKIAQRVMDFITGAAYALDGQVHKISPMIFLTVPRNISLLDENNPVGMEYLKNQVAFAGK